MVVEDVNTAQNYKKATAVWLPCPNEIWIGAVVVDDFSWSDGILRVQLDDSTFKELPIKDASSLPFLRNPEFLIDTNDLTTLSYLHEPDVLHSLKYRFDLAQIYTYCGIVLVAINPYRECDLYGTNIFALYRDRNVRQLDPHIYAVAEEAFASLTRYNKSQSIIVSGESGAGKTVSAKYVMHYLAEACSSSQKRGDDQRIEKRALASNPIMEAIGNAKTVRNDNSSRFGKFIQLLFTERFQMCGAHMRTYLLEKSRVVNQGKAERNYHVFYQICAARNKDPTLKQFGLDSPETFSYLNRGGCVQVNEIDDAKCFFETKDAMKLLGINDADLEQIFSILSGLLHFGNVNFEQTTSQECTLSDSTSDDHLIAATKLWGVQESGFRKWLRYRLLTAGNETIHQGLNAAQARAARDATAKFIYLRLFRWIVQRINDCLKVPSSAGVTVNQNLLRFVGVLDIYGFEIFDLNSFEQLCINYANEMLQQQFNQHVFKLEQAEYVKEGIQWSFINFHDNQPCLDLIEGRLGILDLLDQECKMPSANDENWLTVMSSQVSCNKSLHFTLPKIRKKPGEFIISHFASGVTYKVQGFVEKNTDSVNAEQLNVLKTSAYPLLASLLDDDTPSPVVNGQHAKQAGYKLTALNGPAPSSMSTKKGLATQFRESLRDLKSVLDSTMPHYVRCIKPNDEKLAFTFNVSRTVEQLRACGVLETIRISAAGYPSRWVYDEFRGRYRLLLSKQKHIEAFKNPRKVAELVCSTYLQPGKFELGKTKIFFRTGQVALLESIRSEMLRASAVMIQKTFRGYVARKRYVKIRDAVRTLQAAGRAWLAWRYSKYIQMHRAAVSLQKNIRSFVARRRFIQITTAVRCIQKYWRGKVVRKKLAQMLYNQRVTMIQKYCRGFLVRSKLERKRRAAVVIQCWVRRWLARKEYKRLKLDAKSVERLENLNKGLENKIIELQQRVDRTVVERETFKKEASVLPQLKTTLTVASTDLDQSRKRIAELETEIKTLREQLSTFEQDALQSRQIAETEMVAMNETKEKLESELRTTNEKLSDVERQLEQEKIERQRIQEEFDVISTAASSMQNSRKEDAVSVSSLDFPENQEDKKTPDAGAPISVLLEMERRLDKSIREKERIVQKVHDSSLLKEVQTTFSASERTMFLPLLERLKVEVLEIEIQKLRQELDRLYVQATSGRPDLNSLLESQKKELDRRLEESLMLRSLLAEQFEAGSNKDKIAVGQENEKLRLLVVDQKRFIRNLTDELTSKDQFLIEKGIECERLRSDNERQQLLLVNNLEHGDDEDDRDSIEAVKNNEITRLLSEKLALKKQLEAKNRTIKKLRAAYDAKYPAEDGRTFASMSGGVRQSLGMIQAIDVDQFLRLIIKDFSSSMALQLQPALPSFIVFMAIRYEDHVEHEDQLTKMFSTAFSCIEEATKERLDFDTLAMWLANVWRLLQLCRQYSGEEEFIKFNTTRQNDFQLKRYDLTDFRLKLGELATKIYSKLIVDVFEPLFASAKIVGAVLEFEANIGFFSDSRTNGHDKRSSVDHMKRFMDELNFVHERLLAFGIEWPLMTQIFRQLFRFIEAYSLNELMFRRDLCNFNKGVTIKHNVGSLCNWLRDRNLNVVTNELDRLQQATNLLQMRKTEQDIESINEHGSLLNVAQIVKLMTHYSSMDGIEPKIPVSFIRKLESRLCQARQVKDTVAINAQSVYLPTSLTSAVDFPYVPSAILLDAIEVPNFLEPYICKF